MREEELKRIARERARKWYQANKDRAKAYHRKYYEQNKKQFIERAANWAAINPERRSEIARKWQNENREASRARGRAYAKRKWEENPVAEREKAKVRARQNRKLNPDRIRAIDKKHRIKKWLENRELCLMISRKQAALRRARKRSAMVEKVDYREVLKRDGLLCHICNGAVEPSEVEFDHVIPLAAGGPHSYANISVSHASCNRAKGAKLLNVAGPAYCNIEVLET